MTEHPVFFANPEEFRAWLAENHDKAAMLRVGYYKVATGKPSLTWEQSVEEALCYGWIDGIRNSIDEESYMIRFTPRRPGSHWSQKNIASVEKLIVQGRMQPAGLKAFATRRKDQSGTYAFEQAREPEFDQSLQRQFKANRAAWDFFKAQPAGYRRTVTYWVTSAKRQETRLKRLARVIEVSQTEERVDLMKPFG